MKPAKRADQYSDVVCDDAIKLVVAVLSGMVILDLNSVHDFRFKPAEARELAGLLNQAADKADTFSRDRN